jgi:hypothetical protein
MKLHFSKYNRNVLEKEFATYENFSLLLKSETSDNSDISFEVRKFSSLLLFILFAKISSSSATSLPEILSLSIFYGITANFQFTFQEMKPNSEYWIIKKYFQHHRAFFLGKKIRF